MLDERRSVMSYSAFSREFSVNTPTVDIKY